MQSDFQIPQGRASKPVAPSSPRKASSEASSASATLPTIDSPEVKAPESSPDQERAQGPALPKYTEEELLRVFDEIVFSGEYTETFMVRGKMRVTFRTRTSEEIDDVQKTIDNAGFNLITSVDQLKQIMSLTQALTEYGSTDLATMKFPEKIKFVKSLPGPMVGALLGLLMKFDTKVFQACQEGEANF